MKRTAKQRIDKYTAKINPEIIGSRYDATKELSVRKQKDYFAKAARLESQVKSIINGVPSILHPFYIAYAEELAKKTQDNERNIIYNKWLSRGLDGVKLDKIGLALFGWKSPYIPPYVYAGGITTNKVRRYLKSDLSFAGETVSYGGTIYSVFVDDTYVYAGGVATEKVRRYLKSDLSFVDESVDYGGEVRSIVVDE